MTTIRGMKRLIKEGLYDPILSKNVIDKIENSLDEKMPLLLDGQAGAGKTAGVYYVAIKRGIKITEYNASDDLRNTDAVKRLRNQLLQAYDGKRIILLDEIDKESNLKLLAELVYQNRINPSNTLIIAITNYGWELNKKHSIYNAKMSFVDVFGGNHVKVYRPYANQIEQSLKRKDMRVPGSVKLSTDLRNYEKMVVAEDFSFDEPVNTQSAFFLFPDYMGKPSYRRTEVPTPKQLGGDISKWIIKNGFSNRTGFSIRWWKAEFQNSLELLSLSRHYENRDLLLFFPTHWMRKDMYAHPSSL